MEPKNGAGLGITKIGNNLILNVIKLSLKIIDNKLTTFNKILMTFYAIPFWF